MLIVSPRALFTSAVHERRQSGWLVPIVVSSVVGWFIPSGEHVLGQSERIWTSAMILSGFVAGVLWQRYSPRELFDRLNGRWLGFGKNFIVNSGDWHLEWLDA